MDDDIEKLRQAIGKIHAFSDAVLTLALSLYATHPNKERVLQAFEKSNSNMAALSLYEGFSEEALENFSEAQEDVAKMLRAGLKKP